MNGALPRASKNVLLPLMLVVATLYFAKEFFIPLALAILISFLLAPLIALLERWRFNRVAAVLTATLLAFSVIGGIVYVVGGQLIDLANDLPKYKNNLHEKVVSLRGSGHGPLANATETLHEVTKDFTGEKPVSTAQPEVIGPQEPHANASSKPEQNPVPVSIVYTPRNAFEMLKTFAAPLLAPLGTAALVIVFVVFILLEREDLRDRMIHLIGRGHLQVTTQALDDAGNRVSRYLLAQLTVNLTYGIPIGVGLYFIGIPNAVLWGLLATILRFIPYLGPWIAASFPMALSLAVAPGWNVPMLTFALFVVVELISNNVVEPWLYGSSTGMSPVAIIVSAAFWTWLWGAIGLLLATPLTVCIAVLGKYIPSLGFLDVLLGDKPPIAPEERFYQRLLAGDEEEICEIAEDYVAEHSLAATFEDILIPTLRLCEADFRRGVVSEEKRKEMHRLLRDLVTNVGESPAPEVKEKLPETAAPTVTPLPDVTPALICLPASNEADELCILMLARVLARSGIVADVCPAKLLTSEMVDCATERTHHLILVSVLPPNSVMPATLVCKRLRSRTSEGRLVVGLWGDAVLDDRRRARFQNAGADSIFTSLTQAEREIIAQVHAALLAPVENTPDIAA